MFSKRLGIEAKLAGLAACVVLTACGSTTSSQTKLPPRTPVSATTSQTGPPTNTQAAEAATKSIKLDDAIQAYYVAALHCFDQHDSSIKELGQGYVPEPGYPPPSAVASSEQSRLNADGTSPTQIEGSDSYLQTGKNPPPTWDVDLYPSATAAHARVAPVTSEVKAVATKQGSSFEAHVWPVGQALVITTAAVPGGKVPAWIANCVQTPQTSLPTS